MEIIRLVPVDIYNRFLDHDCDVVELVESSNRYNGGPYTIEYKEIKIIIPDIKDESSGK